MAKGSFRSDYVMYSLSVLSIDRMPYGCQRSIDRMPYGCHTDAKDTFFKSLFGILSRVSLASLWHPRNFKESILASELTPGHLGIKVVTESPPTHTSLDRTGGAHAIYGC